MLSAGTKRTVSRRQREEEDDEAGYGAGEDARAERDGPDVKWTAEGSHQRAALEILQGDEAEEMLRKRMKRDHPDDDGAGAGGDGGGDGDDGLYHGQKAYRSHIAKNKEVPKSMRVGPQRASGSTIRTVTIVDYQPDVCKDYKGDFFFFSFF